MNNRLRDWAVVPQLVIPGRYGEPTVVAGPNAAVRQCEDD